MSRRAWAAVGVLALWGVGVGLLVRRELFRPDTARFAEMGLRITPATMFYAVLQDGRHVGFASSAVDTTAAAITVTDYFVADLPVVEGTERTTGRTAVTLSRAMRLQRYVVESSAGGRSEIRTGRVEGDSVIVATRRSGGAPPDSQRIPMDGPLLMPTLAPLAVALAAEPEIGREEQIALFDPVRGTSRVASLRIAAETLLVVDDSATFDAAGNRWVGALPVPTRAWQVAGDDSTGFSGWIDEQGRVVRGRGAHGLELVRMPYELAYQNWQLAKQGVAAPRRAAGRVVGTPTIAPDDTFGSALLAANVKPLGKVREMRVKIARGDLGAFAIASPLQHAAGDTVRVVIARDAALSATYELGRLTRGLSTAEQREWQQYLRAEPELETMDPDLRQLAARIRASTRDPAVLAERLTHWVHDSLERRAFAGSAGARAVLAARAGDARGHARLFVALARSGGLPARVASGLVRVDGAFYHHTWAEAYLGDWVPVDPTLRQFPADAAHLRLQVGGPDRQAELVRLIDSLDIKLLLSR